VHTAQAGRKRLAGALASGHNPVASRATSLRAQVPGFHGDTFHAAMATGAYSAACPASAAKGSALQIWRKAADDQLAAYTDVPADQKRNYEAGY